jgi:hypothetical protein
MPCTRIVRTFTGRFVLHVPYPFISIKLEERRSFVKVFETRDPV